MKRFVPAIGLAWLLLQAEQRPAALPAWHLKQKRLMDLPALGLLLLLVSRLDQKITCCPGPALRSAREGLYRVAVVPPSDQQHFAQVLVEWAGH